MTATHFVEAILRLALMLVPGWLVAHLLRRRLMADVPPTIAVLTELIVTASVLLLAAELLGLVKLLRYLPLVILLMAVAVAVFALTPSDRAGALPSRAPTADHTSLSLWSAAIAVVVVVAQWCVETANSLGSGILSFDSLWYHMPFAAGFVQSHSVTAIQFTQADPFVAYYPSNSELFHALGLLALHNDFLSPLLNLLWLGVALLAGWCVGHRWRVQPLTLCATALVLGVPVLATTQPGQAFNDILGLAMLLAGVALIAYPGGGSWALIAAGLALGLAVGTKYTFVVAALVLVVGAALQGERGSRARRLALLAIPLILTGGWWYLRALIHTGSPLGLRTHLGPLSLPGARSPMANADQQTVISDLKHSSLWGSRILPGLHHAFGPLWPVLLGVFVFVVIVSLTVTGDRLLQAIGAAGALAAISFVFLPTGTGGLALGNATFEVNLRYLTPALILGLPLLAVLARLRAPQQLPALGPVTVVVLLGTQLEHVLWPAQPARHLGFVLAVTAAGIVIWLARRLRTGSVVAGAAAVALLLGAGGAYAIQRHYFEHRYRGATVFPIYRWAQSVSRARIAVYGSVEQYPLYGARDTNRVDYLGAPAASGGYQPIVTCRQWRTAVDRFHAQFVVLTPGPTGTAPLAWTTADSDARLVLDAGPGEYVFALSAPLNPQAC